MTRVDPGPMMSQHAALLQASAISPTIAEARGYRSVTKKAELLVHGFSERQARVPALLLPIWNVHGEIALYQARPDEPRIESGKAVKYETPVGSRMVLDVPPAARARLGDPSVPLFITEGIRKADAAVSAGLACIDVLGVWAWRGTNMQGGTTALPDWESVALNGRVVYVAFDSDVMTKPAVHAALARLKAFLESRGAHVRLVYLPAGPGGAKVGLDDFLAAENGVDNLLALATSELRRAPGDDAPAGSPYRETPGGLVWDKPTANGTVPVALTNFSARIVAQVVEDDGAEQRRLFEIEGSVPGRTARFRLPAAAFSMMNWPTEHLGAGAIVYAGMGLKDHARVAIQMVSGVPAERVVFTHLGWRAVDRQEVYLHAGGAIGPEGPVEGIEVRLDPPLDRYRLPDLPTGEARVAAIRASLGVLDAAPDRITVPGLGAAYRAVLGESDLSLHFTGPSGAFKTEFAALLQAHFGADMDARHLPGAWSSTANTNEDLAFRAKDALLLVDDFVAGATRDEVSRLQRDAERLFRAQGNRAGRGRMRADTSLRPPRPPRGLLVSTGEDGPRGVSLNARIVLLEVGPDDITAVALTRCQADAAASLYASAMAGFVGWLASQGAAGRERLRHAASGESSLATVANHRRTPRNLQALGAGLSAFLAFADAVDALQPGERDRLWKRALAALGTLGRDQAATQAASDPPRRFRELLGSALTSGRAHATGLDGRAPTEPGAWGWRRQMRIVAGEQAEEWTPQGARVGWRDGNDLYLDPAATFAVVQTVGTAIGEMIGLAQRTLHRRLNEAGLLVSTEQDRGHLTVRRVLEGRRRDVLHLSVTGLQGTAPAASSSPRPAGPASPGLFGGADPAGPGDGIGPVPEPPAAQSPHGFALAGPIGPIGPVVVGDDDPLADGDSPVSRPTHRPELSDDQLIGLVRDRLSAGDLDRAPVRISSGEQIVDHALAAERWFAELEHPGWLGAVARDKLVLLGRALLNDGAGA